MKEKIKQALIVYFNSQKEESWVSFDQTSSSLSFDGDINLDEMASMIEEAIK